MCEKSLLKTERAHGKAQWWDVPGTFKNGETAGQEQDK